MLNFAPPIKEKYSFNNFSMSEKTSIPKINLRGDQKNKNFISKVGKILGMILPKEPCTTSTKEKITSLWLSPNEWLIVSNEEISKEVNSYDLENILFNDISKKNMGSVTNVTDQFTVFTLSGSNIFKILSKGSPFNFDSDDFTNSKVVQTILNHVDVTLHKKNENSVDLYVRRSFANYLWEWLKDSSKLS
jgi:sarcosine oxidase, subunit gamma